MTAAALPVVPAVPVTPGVPVVRRSALACTALHRSAQRCAGVNLHKRDCLGQPRVRAHSLLSQTVAFATVWRRAGSTLDLLRPFVA